MLGDANGTYYDDGNAATAGTDDYAFIWDFQAGSDLVQLAGSQADYVLQTDAAGLAPGTSVWHVGPAGAANELIGVLNNVYGLSLDSNFVFTDTPIA